MGDTLIIDSKIIDKIEIKKELIELQNSKKNRISDLTDNARYLHDLLTKKDPHKMKEINEKINAVIYMINTQNEKIDRARKEGIEISKTINTALYNELIVCNEIQAKLDDMPRLIEKLDELERKIARTMVEIRNAE